jgi:hypothetical protein
MQAVFEQIDAAIGGVPSNRVLDVWERVEPMLARVVRPQTGYTLQSVLVDLQMAKSQLWIIGNFQTVVVTEIQQRPAERVLWVRFIAGSGMDEWLDDWVMVQEAYAQGNDCTAVEFSGRKGWNGINDRHPEYKAVLTTFRRELDVGRR